MSLTKQSGYINFASKIKEMLSSTYGKDTILVRAAYPKDTKIKSPLITYKIKRALNANLKSVKEIAPRQREVVKGDDGRFRTVWGHKKDYYIIFEIWGEDGEEADKWAFEFESFMFENRGYFIEEGIAEKIFFSERYDDTNTNKWRVELSNRTIVYFVRLEDLWVTDQDQIKSINTDVDIPDINTVSEE